VFARKALSGGLRPRQLVFQDEGGSECDFAAAFFMSWQNREGFRTSMSLLGACDPTPGGGYKHLHLTY